MKDKDFCGIVFIGAGSSWSYGATPEVAAKAAAKRVKADWGRYFKLDKGTEINVNVFDTATVDGWEADHRGVVSSETGDPLRLVKKITVTL
jgi:hypothetical protein